ncbi:MAG: LamG-like jellyroll fold domain-containing protein, partial [Planctomycetota bacterium]
MLEKNFTQFLLLLAVLLGFSAAGAMGADILFVSSMEPDHMPGDDAIKAFFEGLGHTVTYIDDDESEQVTEEAALAADLVFISESVGSGDIRDEITEIPTPIIVSEPYAWDEMGLTTEAGSNQIPDSENITIVNANHPMAAGYSGNVPVFTSLPGSDLIPAGTTGGGAVVIARASGGAQADADVYFVYEKGAALAAPPADGSPQTAAETRIGFFTASPTAEQLLSPEGYDLLSAAVDYALGLTAQARNPNPLDGAENVSQSTLQWSAGYTATWHNVYFGTNPTLGVDDLVGDRQTETTYQPPGGLASNATYYWRIDEVEADGTTIHTGAVWSFSTALLTASNPEPLDGAAEVDTALSISWTAGYGAVTHDVYFGADQAAVADATTSSSEFKGNQPATTYGRGTLGKGATYYWRIDQVEADGTTTHKGDVWSFTTKVFAPVVIEHQINWTSDDIEEEISDGDMVGMGDSDLEMPYQDEGKVGEQIVGIRFEDIDVPKGSTISEAWVQFDVDETKDGTLPVSLIIEGELSPDAVTFSEVDFNISNRLRTTAQAVWVPEDWTATHQKDNTSNIASIIQEIIDQKDWAIGNALVLIISNDPDNPSIGTRCAESWNGAGSNPGQIPLLHIEFTTNQAVQPNPADGSVHSDNRLSLSWTPGDTAASHNVYLGVNYDDVEAGAGGTALGTSDDTFYDIGLGTPGDPYPDGLAPGTTYYWRIDEIEADGTTTHKGDVWSFTIPTRKAYGPNPSDKARFVDPDVTLSWEPGSNAISHDVYFGENSAEVSDGTGDTSKGTLTETTFAPGTLEKDTAYYWRIDEFDGSEISKGDVWRFRTLPEIAISDPNLIGWWKLDDGSGTTAIDSSGHANHGTLGNNPQWVFGYDGGAIEFDGTNYIDLPTGLIGTDKGTVCMWIKTIQESQGHIFYGSEETGGDGFGGQNEFHVNMRSSGGRAEFFLEGGDAGDIRVRTSVVNDDTWHHIAATWDAAGDMTVYVDGIDPESSPHNGNIFNLIGRIRLGSPSDYERFYFGSIDDVRLYDYVLTQEEIAETMKGDTRLASDPSPAHESIADKEHAAPLSWSPGENAAQHDVYFGADLDAVADADASDT